MSFDIPRETIFPVAELDIRHIEQPHPFELEHAAEIEANWLREKQDKPALFDGRIMLLASLSYSGQILRGNCHMVRFATFMFWRRLRHLSGEHAFAHAVIVSSDDALIAIRMGSHTVNAGRVYFAAGSFDEGDVRDGRIDMAFNMRREVLEETGLDLAEGRAEPLMHAYSLPSGTVVLFQHYRFAEDAETLAARIRAFVAADSDPEISEPIVIRRDTPMSADLMPHMPVLIDWHYRR